MMNILLIFPNYLDNHYIIPASFHPPLGLAMIAAVLRRAGHHVDVIDATAERVNIYHLLKRIKELNPKLIGITANIAFAHKAFITGKWLKKKLPKIPIMFGGPWPTIDHEMILDNNGADYVVIGEGEETVVELVNALETGTELSSIAGIAYKNGDSLVKTPSRSLIEDLDALPFPAWDLFPSPRKYFFDSKFKYFYPVMTSRGCPMGCIHCTKTIHGYKIRTRTTKNIIDEIEHIHESFKANNILIIDDNFNFDIERAMEICDAIARLKFKVGIHFSNGIRADKLTPELAWKLKRAGTYDVALGIESGNQKIVYSIGKHLDLNAVRRAVKILKKLNIFTTGFIMLGLPGDNLNTFIDTKKFLLEIDLDEAHIFRVIPFPGTRLYDIFKEKGYLAKDLVKNVNFYMSKSEPVYHIDGLPHDLIDFAYEDIYKSFYLRLKKILSYIKKVRLRSLKWYFNFGMLVIFNVLRMGIQASASKKDDIKRELREYKKKKGKIN
ncbi:MAG: B12-binding domain-containing radical SAM protein [Promethearchaeota archaeon]